MDIRDLKFADDAFDVAIDKGAHPDSWICTPLREVIRDHGRYDDIQGRRMGKSE